MDGVPYERSYWTPLMKRVKTLLVPTSLLILGFRCSLWRLIVLCFDERDISSLALAVLLDTCVLALFALKGFPTARNVKAASQDISSPRWVSKRIVFWRLSLAPKIARSPNRFWESLEEIWPGPREVTELIWNGSNHQAPREPPMFAF